MRRPTPLLTATAAAVLGLAALAGCGDTSSDDEAATGGSTTEAGGTADCEAGGGETVTVEIPEFIFEPTPVEISACDSVVWKNTHDQAHTSTGKGDKAWSTGNIAAGSESDPVLFDASGSFSYICALHPFMEGTVEVA